MYQNIDNMIYDADSCEAAICECKRMRKADITAAIIWAAVAVSAFLLILLDAILDINIGDVVAYILLFMLIAFPGICSTIYMIKHGTFGIFFAVTKTIFRIAYDVTMLPYFGWVILIFTGAFACAAMIFGWMFFAVYPIIDIVGLSIKIQTLKHTKEAYAQYMVPIPVNAEKPQHTLNLYREEHPPEQYRNVLFHNLANIVSKLRVAHHIVADIAILQAEFLGIAFDSIQNRLFFKPKFRMQASKLFVGNRYAGAVRGIVVLIREHTIKNVVPGAKSGLVVHHMGNNSRLAVEIGIFHKEIRGFPVPYNDIFVNVTKLGRSRGRGQHLFMVLHERNEFFV